MVTTRYSDQEGSKSRQPVMWIYKQWHRPISKRFIKPPYSILSATSIDSECCRLPTTSVLSKKQEKIRSNRQLAAFLEGEPGPTPAGKTLPHSYSETRLRRERARAIIRVKAKVWVKEPKRTAGQIVVFSILRKRPNTNVHLNADGAMEGRTRK